MVVVLLVIAACASTKSASDKLLADRFEVLMGIASPQTSRDVTFDLLRRQQAAIHGCMTAQGFDYVEKSAKSMYAEGPEGAMSAEAFAAQHGFGFLTLAGSQAPSPKADTQDANLALVSKLSEAGQTAWTSAAVSCEQRADSDVTLFADVAAVRLAANELRSRVQADSRVTSASTAWRTCMSGRGFEFDDRPSMLASLRDVAASLLAAGADAEGSPRHVEFSAQEERELSIARSDVVCRRTLVAAEREVLKAAEGDFLATNRAIIGD